MSRPSDPRVNAGRIGGVVGADTVLPMMLALAGVAAPTMRDVIEIASLPCVLPAGFVLRLLTLRVGIYAPIHTAIYPPRR
jgi:hypothetical protein